MQYPPHEITLSVRDYECDLQGVVNNAVYQNYLEHARHDFLKSRNIDFAELAKNGINLMVIRAELDYKNPLGSSDGFTVKTQLEVLSRLKFGFRQTIIREADQRLILEALITGVAVNEKGKPFSPDFIKAMLV